ncbi:MAG: DNA mismatch repair endonuclease MutH [Gammaproteobacteria bacterium]
MALTKQLLLQNAERLCGQSLGQLAFEHGIELPTNRLNSKGWVGELLEHCLGATAGNKSAPDFESLGIELKSLPLNKSLAPKESTFVCHAPLSGIENAGWQQSGVYQKLREVLWVPFEADLSIDVSLRRVGKIFLWSPSPQQWDILRRDWEEHMETIALGQLDQIDGRRGEYLQLRPKGFSSAARTDTFDEHGARMRSNPRGFYLRSSFTRAILASQAARLPC